MQEYAWLEWFSKFNKHKKPKTYAGTNIANISLPFWSMLVVHDVYSWS